MSILRLSLVLLMLGLGGCSVLQNARTLVNEQLDRITHPGLANQTTDDVQVKKSLIESPLVGPPAWTRAGARLEQVGENDWIDLVEQSQLKLICGHVRKWQRPGPNLEFVRPLLADPFAHKNPNQLVSSQTWFWAVKMSDRKELLVAQSRYSRDLLDVGGYRMTEYWQIRELGYSVVNTFVLDQNGDFLSVSQQLHPDLPLLNLDSISAIKCDRIKGP